MREPVFSPDNLSIAFYAFKDQTIKMMPVAGGGAVTICQIETPTGMNWGPDGTIVFGQGKNGIWRVSPKANSPKEQIVTVAPGQSAHGPQILPDGQHVLFTAGHRDAAQSVGQGAHRGAVIDPEERTENVLVQGKPLVGSDARYIPAWGLLFYAVSGREFAVKFDERRLETTGAAVEIVRGVNRAAGAFTGAADFTVSSEGTGKFVHVPGQAESPISAPLDLALFDPTAGGTMTQGSRAARASARLVRAAPSIS